MTQLSNAEFAQAFSDLAWHHAPEGYYDDLEKKMKDIKDRTCRYVCAIISRRLR